MSRNIKYLWVERIATVSFFLYVSLNLTSCSENSDRESNHTIRNIKVSEVLKLDFELLDNAKNTVFENGLPVKYLTIITDSAFLFETAFSSTQKRRVLEKGVGAVGFLKSGEFILIKSHESDVNFFSGWILAKDVRENTLSAPIVVPE